MKTTSNIIYENGTFRCYGSYVDKGLYIGVPYASSYFDVLSGSKIRKRDLDIFTYPLATGQYDMEISILKRLMEIEKEVPNIVYAYNKDYISIIGKNTYAKQIGGDKFYLGRAYIFNTKSELMLNYSSMAIRHSQSSNVYTFTWRDFIEMYSALGFRDKPQINVSKKVAMDKYRSGVDIVKTKSQRDMRMGMVRSIYTDIVKYSMYMNDPSQVKKQLKVEDKYGSGIGMLGFILSSGDIDSKELIKIIKDMAMSLDHIDENSDCIIVDKVCKHIYNKSQSKITT